MAETIFPDRKGWNADRKGSMLWRSGMTCGVLAVMPAISAAAFAWRLLENSESAPRAG